MNYDVELPTYDHDAVWLEHYGENGGLQITCELGGEAVAFIVSAGWAHFGFCPACGEDIELTTEEVRNR